MRITTVNAQKMAFLIDGSFKSCVTGVGRAGASRGRWTTYLSELVWVVGGSQYWVSYRLFSPHFQ